MSSVPSRRTVRWQRLDRPGVERATLSPLKNTWHIDGRIETDFEGGPARIRYHIRCDEGWRTQGAWVTFKQGRTRRRLGLFVKQNEAWILDGKERTDLRGCVDLDLEVSPATNTLPIRRLDLTVGSGRDVRVGWVRFSQLAVERTEQRYTRVSLRRYRFENLDSGYAAELEVDDLGLVLNYPGFWARAPNP